MVKPIVTSLLAAARPYELAEFYSYAMDAKIVAGFNKSHWQVTNSLGFKMQIYKPSTKKSEPFKGNALSICLYRPPSTNPIDALHNWCKELLLKGAALCSEITLDEFGAETWIADPEGNLFLLVVPSGNTLTP
ncbi:VOC family protein [Prochlorococcus sp. MIT 1341]|uniref:VOC family protein n=1 Tax=Prochlorococcus sp. MIT 1341 TaxID=3096221 RepID=UPI002A764BDB|nr:VOC family protein [Prochlorococcus sp. MIT 1341]